MKTVFLDSSVLFTAVNSPTGGSAKLFTLKNIQLITSPLVLDETERNIRKKLHVYHLERFFLLTNFLTIHPTQPNTKLIEKAKKLIAEKDAVILAQAKQLKTDFLVTLDRNHFLTETVRTFLGKQKALTPKDLFARIEKL